MDFEFAPWERLTSEITDGDANFRFEAQGHRRPDWLPVGQECPWLLRRCGRFVWVRRTESAPAGWNHWFCCPPVAQANLPTADYWPNFIYMLDPKRIEDFANRLWILRNDPLFVVTWNSQWGWRFYPDSRDFLSAGSPNCSWKFRLDEADAAALSSSELRTRLRKEARNAASDLRQTLRFASEFAKLGELEGELLCMKTRTETPQKFVALVRAALRCFDAQWFKAESLHVICSASFDGSFSISLMGEYEPYFGPFERALLQRIVREFEPRLLANSADLSSGLQTLVGSYWQRRFGISVSKPSMHEQLEAQFQLRAWLSEHWPAGIKHLAKVTSRNSTKRRDTIPRFRPGRAPNHTGRASPIRAVALVASKL